MTSIKITAGIPTGYELTIDFDALNETASQQLVKAAAALALIGTASDPKTSIAQAQPDGMGHN